MGSLLLFGALILQVQAVGSPSSSQFQSIPQNSVWTRLSVIFLIHWFQIQVVPIEMITSTTESPCAEVNHLPPIRPSSSVFCPSRWSHSPFILQLYADIYHTYSLQQERTTSVAACCSLSYNC